MQMLLQVLVSLTLYTKEFFFFFFFFLNEYIDYRKEINLVLVLKEKLAVEIKYAFDRGSNVCVFFK